MRRHLLAAGIATSVVVLAGVSLAGGDVSFPSKSKVEKAVAELVSGEIAPDATNEREALFNDIDKVLVKDTKNVALKAPSFWVEAMQAGYFSNTSKGRKNDSPKKVIEDKMQVQYADESVGEVPILYRGPGLYGNTKVFPLLVTVLPKGTDAKAWMAANWEANEVANKGWVLAVVVESDKFPLADQPFLVAHAFGHVMGKFNTNSNQWYLEGVGDACVATQRAACEGLPDRLAGVILREPKKAVTNANTKLFSTYLLGAPDDVAKTYADLDAEHNVAAAMGDGAIDALAAWVDGNPGRRLHASYDFVTGTTDQRVLAPWTGSVFLVSPTKRGAPITVNVTYDRDAGKLELTGDNIGEFEAYMNDDLLDLDRPVSVVCNGQELVTKQFERNLRQIFDTADNLGEYGRAFVASFRGFAPTVVPPADDKKDAGAGAGDGGDSGKEGQ